jgi:hypothetical protein
VEGETPVDYDRPEEVEVKQGGASMGVRFRFRVTPVRVSRAAALAAMLLASIILWARDSTVDDLKQRVANIVVAGRPALCIEISERQLIAADKFYADGESEKASAALVDVATFSEQARDYAIQAHKHEKQSEIAIRKMARKLDNLKHAVTHDEQKQVEETLNRLERVRDDLLAAMFPNVGKKR